MVAAHTTQESHMGTEDPYRMRMNCIHMAKDILSEQMHQYKEVKGPKATPTYTTDDVLREAAKLYQFVCDKKADKTYAVPEGSS
tara:strand:+ start:1512 stop:1763 length:252 start_codon:yes stop_codon:yes gene_type:complete